MAAFSFNWIDWLSLSFVLRFCEPLCKFLNPKSELHVAYTETPGMESTASFAWRQKQRLRAEAST